MNEKSPLLKNLRRYSPLELYNALYQDKISAPTLFPPICGKRSGSFANFKKYGNSNGTDFIVKALTEAVQNHQENRLLFDRNIQVVDESQTHVFDLAEVYTRPDNKKLRVIEMSEKTIAVELVNPPKVKPRVEPSREIQDIINHFYKNDNNDSGVNDDSGLYPDLSAIMKDGKLLEPKEMNRKNSFQINIILQI